MFRLVQKKWKIIKKKSFIIGDQATDMEFGKKAGIRSYLFKSKNLFYYIKSKKIC